MRPAGLAFPFREAAAVSGPSLAAAARAASEVGFASLWLLAETPEQSAALPVTAAALGSAVPEVRVGVRLLMHDRAERMAEDICVVDNVLDGQLEVAVLVAPSLGGQALNDLRVLRDVVNGRPVAGGLAVSPPPRRVPFELWAWPDGAGVREATAALSAGFPVMIPGSVAASLPAAQVIPGRVAVVRGEEGDGPGRAPPAASFELVMSSPDRDPSAIAARLASSVASA